MIKKETTALKDVIKNMETKYGAGIVMKLDGSYKQNIEVIPTGCLSLDAALGIGGIPRGRVIELYGPEASGKTTLALHILAEAQKMGLVCAFIDAEHAIDIEYAKLIGVQIDELYLSQPDSGEQALEVTEKFVKSGEVGLIVIDSVAALTPLAEINGEMGAIHIGLQARLMSQALRKLTAISAKGKTAILFINQIRMNIGQMWGNPETTSGGKALKFYSSMRIEVRRAAKLKKGDDVIGNRVNVKVSKNKLAAPHKTTSFDILHDEGISKSSDVLMYALKVKVLTKSGNSIMFGDKKLAVGIEKAREEIKGDENLMKEIISAVKNL